MKDYSLPRPNGRFSNSRSTLNREKTAMPEESNWGDLLGTIKSQKILQYVFFIALLGLLYIANNHYADRTNRKISNVKSEVEDLRIEYLHLKTDAMYQSRRTEVMRRAAGMGLKEPEKPLILVEE